jgi:allose kinase
MTDRVLGVDIGGTHIRSGMVGRDLSLENFRIASSSLIAGDRADEKLAQFILEAAGGKAPRAVAVGFPSTLDTSRRRLLSTPNLAGFDDIAIAERLENILSCRVVIDRDVNMLFRHDIYELSLPREGVQIAVYVGSGIGNVISIGGRILRGRNGVAAELGHIPMHGAMAACGCGNIGCGETLASGIRLNAIGRECYPGTPTGELFIRHAGDGVLAAFIDDLAILLAITVNLLDPDNLILGGGVLYMPGFPLKDLEARVLAHARKPYPAANLSFLYSKASQEKGVLGAALSIFEQEELTV